MALPRDIREKIWSVARIGGGDATILDRDSVTAEAALLTDEELAADLVDGPDLHDHPGKGLYMVRAADTADRP